MTIYKDIYLGDAAANDAICQMRKDKFARKTHAQKAEFFARMDHMIYFLDLFAELSALGDRAPADVLAAAERIATAKGWLRPALAAADGGVVAAVAPHAAVAMQRLRAAAASSRGSASDSAARMAVAPEPDVAMVDASTTRTVAPPSLIADDDDDPFDRVLFDPEELDDSSDAHDSTDASDWAARRVGPTAPPLPLAGDGRTKRRSNATAVSSATTHSWMRVTRLILSPLAGQL